MSTIPPFRPGYLFRRFIALWLSVSIFAINLGFCEETEKGSVKLRIGHFQCECEAGKLKANTAKVFKGLEWAEREKIDIITFPESFLTGYFDNAQRARDNSLKLDGPEIQDILAQTADYSATWMVGLNELRGEDLFNTVIVVEKGKILDTYSKAFPCYDYFIPGRKFPVFEKKGVKYGVVICADGGYIEPTRILALKGARIIFAPHYNVIDKGYLLDHYVEVRNDHRARAIENGIYFMRSTNVGTKPDKGIAPEGMAYGDSYLVDPRGEILVQSRRHQECFVQYEIDPYGYDSLRSRSKNSGKELGEVLLQTLDEYHD